MVGLSTVEMTNASPKTCARFRQHEHALLGHSIWNSMEVEYALCEPCQRCTAVPDPLCRLDNLQVTDRPSYEAVAIGQRPNSPSDCRRGTASCPSRTCEGWAGFSPSRASSGEQVLTCRTHLREKRRAGCRQVCCGLVETITNSSSLGRGVQSSGLQSTAWSNPMARS